MLFLSVVHSKIGNRPAISKPGMPCNHPKKIIFVQTIGKRSVMIRIQYTGTNYDKVKEALGDRVLAPYFCMGFEMLSVATDEGFVSVNAGDWIVIDEDGKVRLE